MADTPKLILTGPDEDTLKTAGPKLNDLIDLANSHNAAIGDTSGLQTTEKGSLVGAINETAELLAETENNTTALSILNFGGNPDGVTDNTAAYDAVVAKTSYRRPIYFPQNDTFNAVYFFSGNVDFGNKIIIADKGVKISVSSSNSRTYRNAKFLTPIEIVSRDRNNTGKQEPNENVPKWLLPLTGIDEQMGMIDVEAVDLSTWTKTKYDTRVDTQSAHTHGVATNGDYTIATGSVTNGDAVSSIVISVDTAAELNKEYEAWLNHDTGRAGIAVKFSGGWSLFSTENSSGRVFLGKKPTGVAWSESQITVPTSAYFNNSKRGLLLSCRVIEKAVEFYINGAYVATANNLGSVERVGFGLGGSSTSGGTIDPVIKHAIRGYSPKRPKGKPLKIAVYGDSISYGEGANLDWPTLLTDALKAIPQFNRIELRNSAVSGNTASQQLTKLNTEGVSGYNYTLVMVGTNDIQSQTPIATYKQNLIDIITKIKTDGSQPILGVPPVFIDQASTGYGFTTSNYDKGAEYRAVVYRVCAEQGVPVADVMSFIGLVDAQNTIYRDNIHPQSFANTYIAQCFARSVFNHFQKI